MTGKRLLIVAVSVLAAWFILFVVRGLYMEALLSPYKTRGGTVDATVVVFSNGETLVELTDGSRWIVDALVGAPGDKVAVEGWRFSRKVSLVTKEIP